jgi:ferredoxin
MTIIGISGYILVWDERSYIIVLKSVALLKALPLIGETLAKAFLNGDVVSNLTMSMSFFLHTGTSFALLILLWVHYVRISRPVVNVTWAIGSLLAGLVLITAGILPATSGPEAFLNVTPTYFDIDIFYLWVFPLTDIFGYVGTWVVLALITVVLTLLPNFVKSEDKDPATVSGDNCVGCKLCSVDCPYEAIYMAPRTDGSKYKEIAVVIDDRCAECGLCVGACNFDAIELPGYKSPAIIDDIRIALLSEQEEAEVAAK